VLRSERKRPTPSHHPAKVTVPPPKVAGPVPNQPAPVVVPVVPSPARNADTLPWKTVDVSKSQFLGLMTNTTFDHDTWAKAIKEAEAGKDFAKQATARSLETVLKAPPVLSGRYSNQNAQAKEWVKARAYELRWQTFEQAARNGTMPEFKESQWPRLDQKIAKNGGYFKTADQIRLGFLGPDFKMTKAPTSAPATDIRFVSADGRREFRQFVENGETRMEFLTIGRDSVSAVRLHL
jgi:hypothetical protein